MKNMYYDEESHIISERNSRYYGLKSLIYFILIAALLFSMLFLPEKINASDIQIGAQITNKAKCLGILSGRFLKDFDTSDLYIIAYPKSDTFDLEKVFSLTTLNNDPKNLVWKNQISMFSAYGCIKAGGWGALSSIDFNPLKNQSTGEMPDLVFALLLIKSGGDPLNPTDWIDTASTSLITDSSQRVPGQTQFLTDTQNDKYRPTDAEDANVEQPLAPDAEDTDDNNSDVEKPDIYKISGSLLFYANGSAGRFQVVNISKPDTPRLIYSESLKNTPLDLYINNDYVILLEQMNEQNDISVAIKIFHVQDDAIIKVSDQAYANIQYSASRKSGDRIFITGTVPYYYNYDTSDGETAEGGSLVAAVDISNPASPALLSKKNLEGYDSDIYINSDYLVQIARVSWETTLLYLFDLNQNDPLTKIAEIKIPGRIPSEYHVNISDNSLFVIYRDQDISKGSSLKIFDINSTNAITPKVKPDSMSVNKDIKLTKTNVDVKEKGSVNGIAPGEELFAATFMDDRAYIVTYERQDPLWVVDISDHFAPKIIGELQVPGWSEYIRFYKNRLVALGYDDSDGKRRVSVALFSVEDPLKPVLLDRATPLSGIADYTYSVAIDDDRGFYWNTSSGVIMVPIGYYTDGNYSGLDIIHVDPSWNSFIREDFVAADFNVQRGTEADSSDDSAALADIALSMGDAALNTINISSTQKPVILGELRLAYNVEKITIYESGATQAEGENEQEESSLEQKSIFALGGDFYTNGTSDLMRYDSRNPSEVRQNSDGQFDFTAPSEIKDSELLYPELLMGKNGFGVIFSWSSAAFRLFDQTTMTMGSVVKLGDTSTWTTSNPIVSNKRLYFAVSQYYYPKYENDEEVDKNSDDYVEDSYSIQTTLKRYDCSDMNAPKQMPDISIPGTPKAVFNNTRLIT
ncbi:MAG: beta-propeller domain-containing protein, partial [Desulfamplus sp.]|nr:beta-propeller domain-containing protein [Desulfamplus sp.]